MSTADKEQQQMKKIYNNILSSGDSDVKKKGLRILANYGRKAVPFLQELRSIETDDDMRNYMFDIMTQIEKGNL
jgi:hypothetical protein